VSYFDLVVIGGGASGLMCAQTAAQRGLAVLVIDSSKRVGKKILMSGGGRCNFTNLFVEADNFISTNPHFCKSALTRYSQWDFIALVEKHGIAYHERDHGQLFCNDSAKAILKMLLDECETAGVKIRSHCRVEKITPCTETETVKEQRARFILQSNQGEVKTHALVVATGGLSIPTMGSSGFGYEVARQFGLQVLPQRAGLVPFMFSDGIKGVCERLSGIAVKASLSAGAITFTENMLFTHRGLSGPAVLQLSNYWQTGEAVSINLCPDLELLSCLKENKASQGKMLLRSVLARHLPKKLVAELEGLFWEKHARVPIAQLSDAVLEDVAKALTCWQVKPSGTEGYRTAEVTLGGVDTRELSSKTMESKSCKGLYFIGEVVDVTGHLGGYNFQWAWSSGYAAGQSV
jgi:hypothetical protein